MSNPRPTWNVRELNARLQAAADAERALYSVPLTARRRERSVIATWLCICREWTMPRWSRDRASCHACGRPRPPEAA